MGFYKATKFPFEVTKGKSKELFQLRFMRKSELEPNLRHNFRQNICQMGRQLDIWFKEQVYTIGSLSKEQEKLYQSRRRLRKEIRRSKKREYAHRQEQIREKLQKIKINMMAMKVIHKWKDNLRISKLEREANQAGITAAEKQPDVNDAHKTQASRNSDEKTLESDDKVSPASGRIENTSLPDIHKKETNIDPEPVEDVFHVSDDEKDDGDGYDGSNSDIDSGPDLDYDPDDVDSDSLYGGRYSSSQGPRMETIPEEINEAEPDNTNHSGLPKLTKRRLSLLNRSHSKRDVFEGNDQVPLLPDLGVNNLKRPETTDKETQTSEKSAKAEDKTKGANVANQTTSTQTKRVRKKKIIVTLPSTPKRSTRDRRSEYGRSRPDDNDSSDSDSDDDFIEGFAYAQQLLSDCEDYDDNDVDVELAPFYASPNDYVDTKRKHKSSFAHKSENNFEQLLSSQTFPTVNKIEPNFPPASPIGNHSPFPIHYRDKSFHVTPNFYNFTPRNISAKSRSKLQNGFYNSDMNQRNAHEAMKQQNEWRCTDEMRVRLESEAHPHMSPRPKMAIFGRKPNSMSESITPPNSPRPSSSNVGMKGSMRTDRNRIRKVLYTQKQAKANEQKKIHEVVVKEPVQQYERTRSGRIKPLGTPRTPTCELKVPSYKEQYYRDKLLKTERDSILKQNIKMKRFINFMEAFKDERNSAVLPPIPGSTTDESEADGTNTDNKPKRTIGNLFFKVQQTEQDANKTQKVVAGASTNSLRLLKDCRYLREYKPMTIEEKMMMYPDKESSWNMQNTSNYYSNTV
ncbi:hypothetical protein ACF0H5_010694 [Mactra antiquata]